MKQHIFGDVTRDVRRVVKRRLMKIVLWVISNPAKNITALLLLSRRSEARQGIREVQIVEAIEYFIQVHVPALREPFARVDRQRSLRWQCARS